MSEIYEKDESIHEPTTAHIHPLETIPQGSQADGAEGQHEHRDVSFGALGKWFTGLFVGIAASFVLMWGFFNWAVGMVRSEDERPSEMWHERQAAKRAWPDPKAESPLQKPTETPILLPEPEEPYKKLRKQDEQQMEGYNWAIDEKGRKTGAVTMPIDKAIDLTVQRGLPADNKTQLRPDVPTGEKSEPGEVR